jgi:hypothetical protein
MAINETSGFARSTGRWALWRLGAALASAASAASRAMRRRRRAPPAAQLSRHLRRDIGLDRD